MGFSLEQVATIYRTPAVTIRLGGLLDRIHPRIGGLLPYQAFHAVHPVRDGYLVAFRRFCFTSIGRLSLVYAVRLDHAFRRRARARFLCLGEDPRLFSLRGTLYVLTWVHDRGREDSVMSIVDVARGRRTRLRLAEPGFFGKNWIPFEWRGGLHFIYSLDPLNVLACDVGSGRCEWVHRDDEARQRAFAWHDNYDLLGRRRGGSQGLTLRPDEIVGFGHETAPGGSDKGHHVPFLFHLDLRRRAVRYAYPDETNASGLFDPTSVFVHDRDLYVGATRASGLWDHHQVIEGGVYRIARGWERLQRGEIAS